MELQDQLLKTQIEKTQAETALAIRQHKDLENAAKAHLVQRIAQGIGAGLVIALAAFALFQPIVDAQKAVATKKSEVAKKESELASLEAKIANATNVELRHKLENREKLLRSQEEKYKEDLAQLAADLKKANAASEATIARSEKIAEKERIIAEQFEALAKYQEDNAKFKKLASEAEERSIRLAAEIEQLRDESAKALVRSKAIQEKVDFSDLYAQYVAIFGETDHGPVKERLSQLGVNFEFSLEVPCSSDMVRGVYWREGMKDLAVLVSKALEPVLDEELNVLTSKRELLFDVEVCLDEVTSGSKLGLTPFNGPFLNINN